MAMINPMREGSWWFRSDSDPRWNMAGRGIVGMYCGFEDVPEAVDAMERKKRELGEDPPSDLGWGYMKD